MDYPIHVTPEGKLAKRNDTVAALQLDLGGLDAAIRELQLRRQHAAETYYRAADVSFPQRMAYLQGLIAKASTGIFTFKLHSRSISASDHIICLRIYKGDDLIYEGDETMGSFGLFTFLLNETIRDPNVQL